MILSGNNTGLVDACSTVDYPDIPSLGRKYEQSPKDAEPADGNRVEIRGISNNKDTKLECKSEEIIEKKQ